MAIFLVTADKDAPARYLVGGANCMVVVAADAAGAKTIAKAFLSNDNDATWANATVTEIAAATDWAVPVLWNFSVRVTKPSGVVVADVEVQSSAADNTVDEVAALLVTALNATPAIAGAAYDGTGNVLTVAETTDALGDCVVTVAAWPDVSNYAARVDSGSGFFGAVTDEGLSTAALSVVLAGDADPTPDVVYMFKSI